MSTPGHEHAQQAAHEHHGHHHGPPPASSGRELTRNAISVGRRNGAAELLGVKLKGRLALTIKDLIEWEYRQSITRLHGYSAATVV